MKRLSFQFRRQTRHPFFADLVNLSLLPITLLLWLAPLWGFADLFRQVWPVWALLSVLLCLAAIALRQPRILLIASMTILIIVPIGGELWRMSFAGPSATLSGGLPVTFATHNIWGRNRTPQVTSDYLIDLNADILALQEAGARTRDIHQPVAEHYAYVSDCRRASARIFSHLPILESGCMRDILDQNRAPGAPAWRWDIPSSTWARIQLPDGSNFVVISVHFTWPNPLSFQNEERINFTEIIQVFDQDSLVILGDFNAAAPSAALNRFDRDMSLIRRTHGIATWPSNGRFTSEDGDAPPLPTMVAGIDHIYAGNRWATANVRRGPNTGSDHRPIESMLIFRPPSVD